MRTKGREQATDQAERGAFFTRALIELERLRDSDPGEWVAYRAESLVWENATIADGLGPCEESFWLAEVPPSSQ